jgi:hypothetical protein
VIARRARIALVWAMALLAVFPAFGAQAGDRGTLTYVLENDLFYRTDGGYTNGAALIWVPDATPDWVSRVAHWFPWIPKEGHVRHGYALGQAIFTPQDLTLATPPLDDRPYAGWLYGTLGLGIETGLRLDQFALTLGVVGPASGAEQTQAFVHEITNSRDPQGWDTQLGNEPGIVLTYLRSWRQLATAKPAGLALDMTPHVGGALGNVYTYANAGLTLRLGQRLPLDFGPPRVQPSLPNSGCFAPADKFAWYLFAGIEGRAVAHNIFLDGNTFKDSRSVDAGPLVGELQFGLVLTWGRVRLSYTHVLASREFTTQPGNTQFGVASVSVAF